MKSLTYRMEVKVNPGTSQTSMRWRSDHLKVNLTARAEDGKANQQLLTLLASKFGVARKDIEIERGEHSEYKTVLMRNLNRETLVRRLNELKW